MFAEALEMKRVESFTTVPDPSFSMHLSCHSTQIWNIPTRYCYSMAYL